MAFDKINELVTKHGFSFQAWDDRYSKGIWAALGLYEEQVDVVRDLSSMGDLDMIPAMDFVFSADWLPYVTGLTMLEAMQKLEDRLQSLPSEQLCRNSQWATLVMNAIEQLSDATRGRSSYGDKSPDLLKDLPPTFEAAVSLSM